MVDKASTLDLILANKLIKAVPPGAHLLLVGDVDQLPSVGAGEVLPDLLAADPVPRVRLTQVFRQAADSGVVSNAHRINAGRPPILLGMNDLAGPMFNRKGLEREREIIAEAWRNNGEFVLIGIATRCRTRRSSTPSTR